MSDVYIHMADWHDTTPHYMLPTSQVVVFRTIFLPTGKLRCVLASHWCEAELQVDQGYSGQTVAAKPEYYHTHIQDGEGDDLNVKYVIKSKSE